MNRIPKITVSFFRYLLLYLRMIIQYIVYQKHSCTTTSKSTVTGSKRHSKSGCRSFNLHPPLLRDCIQWTVPPIFVQVLRYFSYPALFRDFCLYSSSLFNCALPELHFHDATVICAQRLSHPRFTSRFPCRRLFLYHFRIVCQNQGLQISSLMRFICK